MSFPRTAATFRNSVLLVCCFRHGLLAHIFRISFSCLCSKTDKIDPKKAFFDRKAKRIEARRQKKEEYEQKTSSRVAKHNKRKLRMAHMRSEY